MPRIYSSIEKIRAELAWVNETPDPNKWAAVMCDAAKKLDTGQERVLALSQRSSGRRWEYYCAPCREYEWCGAKHEDT
jgi:hypothetical protein